MPKKIHIVNCEDHGQEVIIYDGQIIYQDDVGTEVLWRVAGLLDISISSETINSDEYERRYA